MSKTAKENVKTNNYKNPYSKKLIESKNIIFRGAPGTGKTYLAKKIATDIISNGSFDNYNMLNNEQKSQIEFVQFHPSYDYSDFVEGLRPKINNDGTMGFKLQDGIFKKFVDCARKNYENSQKSNKAIGKEIYAQKLMEDFFSNVEFGKTSFKTVTGNEFYITDTDENYIYISIRKNNSKLKLSINDLQQMVESEKIFDKVNEVRAFFGKKYARQKHSYYFALYKEIQEKIKQKKSDKDVDAIIKKKELKKYVFIIDEINRGEISKIFGELFFAIDPGYRGPSGEVSTQYSNLHSNPEEKFYIPENVYIIGTMNDIDRSVDSFDFAMRRRFRFIELKANEHIEMLSALEDESKEEEAKTRMLKLNHEISNTEGLNENYHIGASYFLKSKTLSFNQLWEDYLCPLLQDYIQGMYDEDNIMKKFAKAYGYNEVNEGIDDEASQG